MIRNVHLKHRISKQNFKIPPLAPMDLNRKHFSDDRTPVESMLNYLSNNIEQATEEGEISQGVEPLEKVTKKVKKKVKGWLESTVWDPIKIYVGGIVGGLPALIATLIAIKLIHKAKVAKICKLKEGRTPQQDNEQVYIIRGPKKTQSTGPESEALV